MGFDLDERKTLLYADLFKPFKVNHQQDQKMITVQKCEGWCASSNQSSSFDSSSSGFSTPLGSELGSSEASEDGDFVAELSRQMAECMLQEEEKEVVVKSSVTDSAVINDLKYGLNSSHTVWDMDRNQKSCLEVKHQPRVSKQVPVSVGRRVKGAELTQPVQFQKTEQSYRRYRQGEWRKKRHVGSGMKAIFLGGYGPRNWSSGTGVFLPRAANNPVEQKKKSGLSTVLIPTRVLETLELHFNRVSDSATTSFGPPLHASPRDEWCRSKGQGKRYSKFQKGVANKDEDQMQILPQEWTY